MRLIDADVLYKEVTEKYCDIVAGRYPFNIVAYDMAEMVKNSPTVEPVRGEWIAVEERLPEDQQEVLVTLLGNSIYIGWFDLNDNKWNIDEFECDDECVVTAWRPLPEPYNPDRKNVEE